ncbi:MAG: 2-iminoacetate synthase ThiH [Succinivibrionaceae bacterium]|nr:2-iminoacetate synthase ThiH [Ruminobacter sp.]MDY5779135.1 2-iminoacetate synthase ThiH [Succinivibrionaceae bacterium]MEE1340121.1 2-iminoacetate synthase ThiH [Succinivibrionaceae bacterium]
MSFYDEITSINIMDLSREVDNKSENEVLRALSKARNDELLDLGDFMALISPKATKYLREMSILAKKYTRRRFGNGVSMYVPLYLSNLCSNNCSYCGFAVHNKFARRVLNAEETELECQAIQKMGYENILVVTGENQRRCGMDYFREMLPIVQKYSSYMSMEVQPMDTNEYAELKTLGVDAVMVYQETYDPECYKQNHLSGKKTDMRYRMETPERLGDAGIDKVGIGALLGLFDWKADTVALAMHLLYMRKHYWQTRMNLSFPRLRPAAGGFEPVSPVGDIDMIKVICAWRLFDHELEISISTRENALFRDAIVPIAITSISAQSSTAPGGYAVCREDDLPQFIINDDRSVKEVTDALKHNGLEPIFREARSSIIAA